MIDSKASVVVGGQGPHDRLAGVLVVPDCGGQGEDTLQDPDRDAGDGAALWCWPVGLTERINAARSSSDNRI
jgi:hypothetical protein